MTTLHNLQSLPTMALTHADNPALSRCERTVEGVARCYLPRILSVVSTHPFDPVSFWPGCTAERQWDRRALDLTDPGTAHALLVALALAHGMDPGPASLDVRWSKSGEGWNLSGPPCAVLFRDYSDPHSRAVLCAPTVALETNPTAALEAAVKHTLEQA